MDKPEMIFFDYGHTLCYEPVQDYPAGWAEVMRHAVRNPQGVTAASLAELMTDIYSRVWGSMRPHELETDGFKLDAEIYESLGLDFDVSLEELGFCERSASAVLHTPWFALDARPVVGDRGAYFVLAKGKEASVAYNLIGINWAFRDEDVSGVLFLPNEVIEKNLGLVEGVRSSIRDARARYLGKGVQAAADGRVAAWMRGEPASPESAGA